MGLHFQHKLPEELPQSYEQPLYEAFSSRTSTHTIDTATEDLKETIIKKTKEISGLTDDQIEVLPLTQHLGLKGSSGFRIIDVSALQTGRNDQIELLSVIILKSKDSSCQFVPVVIPHTHPEHIGQRVKDVIDTEFLQTHDAYPLDLVKSRTRRWIENKLQWLKEEPKRLFLFSIAACSILFVGGAATTQIGQRYKQDYDENIAHSQILNQGAQKLNFFLTNVRLARTIQDKQGYLDELFNDGDMGYSSTTQYLQRKLESNDEKDRIQASNAIREILLVDFQQIDSRIGLIPLHGSYNGRALLDSLQSAAHKERVSSVKENMTSTIAEIQTIANIVNTSHGR